jgi:HSP20 family molecular chaperone IbpA
MNLNILKKNNEPVVDQSLETTRNIEFQLLNMKKELQKFFEDQEPTVDITPAVTHTLETLHQIDTQLQNMYSVLENFTNELKGEERPTKNQSGPTPKSIQPTSPPNPQRGPPTFPPTYPGHSQEYQPYPYHSQGYYPRRTETPKWQPNWSDNHPQGWHQPNNYPKPQRYEYYSDQYPYHYDAPDYRPPPYSDYYNYYHHPRYYNPYWPEYDEPYTPYGAPYYDEYHPRSQHEYQNYQSARYPTVANSEPAYSSASNAIPSTSYKIAYYPWQQMTGERTPTNSRVPYLNIYDIGNEYIVYVELPGVDKDNLELRVDEQAIWLSGKPTIVGAEDGTPVVQEHGYHEFYRQVTLPSKVIQNKTTCVFENGILKIKLVKNNPKKSSYKVKIH